MNLDSALQQLVTLTATLDLRIAVLLFAICAIGEFGMSVPYVLESIWLLAGYQVGAGLSSPLHLLGLWFSTQCGRQVGALMLYRLCRYGASPLQKIYQKLHLERFFSRVTSKSSVFNRINLSSPFSVAYGRLLGMRIPMALTLAMKRKPGVLALGVLLSSLDFDAVYVLLGMFFGSTTTIKPAYILLASLGGVTIIYLSTFTLKRLIRRFHPAA